MHPKRSRLAHGLEKDMRGCLKAGEPACCGRTQSPIRGGVIPRSQLPGMTALAVSVAFLGAVVLGALTPH